MPTPVFQLTSDELQGIINPNGGDLSFQIGAGKSMTVAQAENYLLIGEDDILSRLPWRYRQLLRTADVVVVRNAQGGETSLSLGLFPVDADTVRLYVNYQELNKAWNRRNNADALPITDYTVTEETGIVQLLTPLEVGDSVFATFNHTAPSKFVSLRNCALQIAAVHVSRAYAYFRTADGFDRFERMEASAYRQLKEMQGIDQLDRLELVNEQNDDQFGELQNI
jgi:hypothetical protein